MKLHLFDIPDDPVQVAGWLETQVMGLHLRQLVAELSIMGNACPQQTLDAVLGSQRHKVLASGLGCLERPQLRQLLNQPDLLLELQRLVLDEGSDYWISVPASPDMEDESQRRWKHLEAAIDNDKPTPVPTPPRSSWLWSNAGWCVALAVCLIAVLIQTNHISFLEKKVSEQTLRRKVLQEELETQRMLAAVRVLPADLPDSDVRSMSADPRDLPNEDPEDLPDQNLF